jgi:large subunit ribosomal protein L18
MSGKADGRAGRLKRKVRVRKKVFGTPERPRLSVFRSARHMYAQVIDDVAGVTLASASTVLEKSSSEGGKVAAAKAVGASLAKACLSKDISAVVFDRNGYRYHGRVQAVADAAREAGLKF